MDPDMMQKIQDNMFTFENLVGVDNKGIQTIMRNVEPDLMMKALKGASDAVKDKFLGNMSERDRGMFKDDMEALGPMRLADVEEAQKIIMRAARKLADAGDLVLGDADGLLCVPYEDAETLLAATHKKMEQEKQMMADIAAGRLDTAWIDAALKRIGCNTEPR